MRRLYSCEAALRATFSFLSQLAAFRPSLRVHSLEELIPNKKLPSSLLLKFLQGSGGWVVMVVMVVCGGGFTIDWHCSPISHVKFTYDAQATGHKK